MLLQSVSRIAAPFTPYLIACVALSETDSYVIVGHCCETGDLLTPAPNEGDVPHPRLCQQARIGDLCVIEGAGAYCASMSAKNYNSFPEAAEVSCTCAQCTRRACAS